MFNLPELQTQPNFAFVGEEVRANASTLQDLAKEVANIIVARFAQGKAYGVGIIPEGLIEFIPEVGTLIAEVSILYVCAVSFRATSPHNLTRSPSYIRLARAADFRRRRGRRVRRCVYLPLHFKRILLTI